ncbi:DUF4123 domain-containing protein [Cupriavidus oxalaticus]|uniref:DUF4123 domain-containing protein n=1 Tax=Cupriavidus oxalaticus TaxID=96344 RepID=A0A5P3VDJ6_9BURK|nr:DUF4123 domain-containing protein [Cupriavidus oxalaticus]QEZ44456.1 DUF4123 domain-containing protein [Cupriavidus oxalaticus]
MMHSDWRQPALRGEFGQAMLLDVRRWLTSVAGPEKVAPYALIDAGQLHLTEVDLETLLRQNHLAFEPILRHTPEAGLESVGPYLVELSDANAKALEAVAGLMEHGWPVCFLSSRLPDLKLHTHLRGCLNGLLESGAPVQLRYYDSRVMASLLELAPEDVRVPLLAPLDAIAWWNRTLRWEVARGSNSRRFQSADASFSLSDTLISALGRAGEPDLILSQIAEEDTAPGELDALAPHLQYQIVADLVRRAREHGLSSKAGIRVFCSIGLRVCPTFDQALAGIAQALTSSNRKEEAFLGMVARVINDQWTAMGKQGALQLAARRQRFADDIRLKITP